MTCLSCQIYKIEKENNKIRGYGSGNDFDGNRLLAPFYSLMMVIRHEAYWKKLQFYSFFFYSS